jgi:hypothetical protein
MPSECSAQVAADYPTNSAYASGWSEALAPQNGGFGFGAWSFAQSTGSPVQASLGTSILGTSWTLFNPAGAPSDLVNAGRSIVGGLQVGDTISTTIVNPTTSRFFRGYTILLGSGGENIGYNKVGTRLAVGTFEYFTYGRWFANDIANHQTSLFNTETAAAGMRLDVMLTGANTYSLTMTPLINPADAYQQSGTLNGSNAVNWIQFQMYNTASGGPGATNNVPAGNFYIGDIVITSEFTCPSPIVVTNDPGQCSAVVEYTVTNNCNCLTNLTSNPPSGATFPQGTNTVLVTGVDRFGNTNTCSFTVTVLDKEPPRVSCQLAPNPSGKINAPDHKVDVGLNPSGYYQVFAQDNCDPNPAIFVMDTGSSFVAGPFRNGDIVRVKHTGHQPSSSPGSSPVVAVLSLNGDGLVVAVDAGGNVTPDANSCLLLVGGSGNRP